MIKNYIANSKKIFFVGIKGVAMANLAVMAKKMGKTVNGSDVGEDYSTDGILNKNQIRWSIGFSEKEITPDLDLLVYSASHQGKKNPQVVSAEKQGIKTVSQALFINEIMSGFPDKVAVCGCHGKTTTSSLMAYALIRLNEKPSYLVGAASFSGYPAGDYQPGRFFVVEADEYGVNPPLDRTPKLKLINPNFIICNNIDFDHPDVYADLTETKKAFSFFFDKVVGEKDGKNHLFFCQDDKVLMDTAKNLPRDSYLTYGLSKQADLVISDWSVKETESSFALSFRGSSWGRFTIKLFGLKNISNAAGVILALANFGFSIDQIKRSVAYFKGADRRFELIAKVGDTYLFDDYAHHPHEIATTIEAVRERFKNRRLIVVFEPHTFSRTKALLDDFALNLAKADLALIAPIFASARENPENFDINSEAIVAKAEKNGAKNLLAFSSYRKIIEFLSSNIQSGDVIFTMGAGHIYKMKNDIIKILPSL